MSQVTSKEIRLHSRPKDMPEPENFELAECTVAAPKDGEVQIRNLWMSVDPYMANRFHDRPNYIPPFRLGKPLDGGAVGRVIASSAEGFAPGDLVSSNYGWREAFTTKAERLTRLPSSDLPPQAYLSIAGITGMTAYMALFLIGELKEGETVFISAAAGAVGSTACQMAKIKGCTVIGTAGGADKVNFLKEIGVDHAIDYKSCPDLVAAVAQAAPDGIDLYLDNVGGDHLKAALNSMKDFGRIVVSGMISNYGKEKKDGPDNLFEIVAHRLTIKGFLLFDRIDEIQEDFFRDVPAWIREGKLISRETVESGIERAPEAFLKLMSGKNIGKMLVHLVD